MLVKSAINPAPCLKNRREIVVADEEPKVVGSIVRERLMKTFGKTIVPSQWGDGFGAASCELAHLGAESFGSIGAALKLTVIKI